MVTVPATPGAETAKAEWLHWLFVRGHHVISCTIDSCGDGLYIATMIPVWSPNDRITEMFRLPAEAVRWQEVMTHRLHAAGWLLVEYGAVRNAA